MKRLMSAAVRRDIAVHAYFLSEKQGFAPGHEFENWILAEREILGTLLNKNAGRTPANARRPASDKGYFPRKVNAPTGTSTRGKLDSNDKLDGRVNT